MLTIASGGVQPDSASQFGIRSTAAPDETTPRLQGLDALRGAAALLVMLFHYTTRYQEKFGHASPPSFQVAWGHLGVNLFFMISGFVIFMTLERTKNPVDFLVSRFSRLFPVYWTAALLTYFTCQLVPELGTGVTHGQAVANVLMFHGLLGVPHIDGVYWTLEVELLFYWAMFLLWLMAGSTAPHRWLAGWLALSISAGIADRAGVHLPYIVSRVLILPYLPYFALGVLLYLYFVRHSFRWSVEGLLGAVALVAIGLIDSPTRLVWACGFLCLFPLVVFRWPSSFVVRVLARVGLVSYPFYLVHETIGWAVIQGLEARGAGANEAIAIAFGVALALACLVHAVVERPATRWVRRVWNQSGSHERGAMGNGRAKWIAGTLLIGIAILIGNRLTLNG